jgi:hypothetical protein
MDHDEPSCHAAGSEMDHDEPSCHAAGSAERQAVLGKRCAAQQPHPGSVARRVPVVMAWCDSAAEQRSSGIERAYRRPHLQDEAQVAEALRVAGLDRQRPHVVSVRLEWVGARADQVSAETCAGPVATLSHGVCDTGRWPGGGATSVCSIPYGRSPIAANAAPGQGRSRATAEPCQ